MKKFLLLTDVLFSTNSRLDQKRWYPPILWLISQLDRILKKKSAEKILAWFDKRSQKNFSLLLVAADRLRPNGCIGIGNYTIATNEKGNITPECIRQFDHFWKVFHGKFLRWIPKAIFSFAPGNHDLGYRYELPFFVKIGTKEGGPSSESVMKFKELFRNSLYGLVDFGDFFVMYVSSVLIRNGDIGGELVALEAEGQSRFLIEKLDSYDDKKPLFLVIHDPKVIWLKDKGIENILYRNKDKVAAIIHGHMHSTLLRRIVWLTCGKYRKLCRNFKVVCAIEPGGFFGIGGGFSMLTVNGDGSWEAQNHKL